MPFNNDIAGGNGALVRNQLISPNFVSGVSGWRIGKDGNVEFNNGTFRGSITSGNPAAAHIVINNGVTGDAVDVYDATNALVYSINAAGAATSYYRGGGLTQNTQMYISGATLILDKIPSTAHNSSIAYFPNQTGVPAQKEDVHIQVPSSGTGETLIFDLLSGSFDNTQKAGVQISARGVVGYAVYTDNNPPEGLANGVPNVIHPTLASGTTVNLGGPGVGVAIPHGASFTPTGAIAIADVGHAGVISQYLFNVQALDATNVTLTTRRGDGTAVALGETVWAYMIVWK